MSTETAVAAQDWHIPTTPGQAFKIAETIAASGLAPKGLQTPEQVMVAAMYGADLDLSVSQALRMVTVIHGRPTLSAKGLLGLAMRHRQYAGHRWLESTTERATLQFQLKGRPEPEIPITFTYEDAQRAGLAKKGGSWDTYRDAMLRARATSKAVGMLFPDITAGLMTPEEAEESEEAAPSTARVVTVTQPSSNALLDQSITYAKAERPEAKAVTPAAEPVQPEQNDEVIKQAMAFAKAVPGIGPKMAAELVRDGLTAGNVTELITRLVNGRPGGGTYCNEKKVRAIRDHFEAPGRQAYLGIVYPKTWAHAVESDAKALGIANHTEVIERNFVDIAGDKGWEDLTLDEASAIWEAVREAAS